jgi:predicted nucleic acid-binding protein
VARLSYLLDTDVLIDWLDGQAWAKTLIWDSNARLYCSNVSRKELLAKRGLKNSERKKILRLLRLVRVVNVDSTIAAAASELLQKYAAYPLRVDDALVAATAWVKRLPLLTRNRKHYEFVAEIELAEFPFGIR